MRRIAQIFGWPAPGIRQRRTHTGASRRGFRNTRSFLFRKDLSGRRPEHLRLLRTTRLPQGWTRGGRKWERRVKSAALTRDRDVSGARRGFDVLSSAGARCPRWNSGLEGLPILCRRWACVFSKVFLGFDSFFSTTGFDPLKVLQRKFYD